MIPLYELFPFDSYDIVNQSAADVQYERIDGAEGKNKRLKIAKQSKETTPQQDSRAKSRFTPNYERTKVISIYRNKRFAPSNSAYE